MIKKIVLISGAMISPLPTFHLGANNLAVKSEEKYVGVNLRTDTRNMFQERTARYCGHRIMVIEDMTGRLTNTQRTQTAIYGSR